MWANKWCWKLFKKFLESKGYVVCHEIVLPYHRSRVLNKKLGTTGIKHYVQSSEYQISAIRKKYDLEKTDFYIVGHSMGGLIVQKLLCKHQDWFKKAVLLTPAAPAGIFSLYLSVLRSFFRVMMQWAFWKIPNKLSKKTTIYSMLHTLPKKSQEEIVKKMGYESGQACAEIGFWPIDQLLHGVPATQLENPGKVLIPILVVSAEKDRITPARIGQKIAALFQNAEYVCIPNACHYSVMEDKEIFQKVLNFLDSD